MSIVKTYHPVNPALLHGKGKFYKWRVFVVAFIAYSSFHVARSSWGSVKPEVSRDLHWKDTFLGTLDMLFMVFYGVGLLISGIIGDYVNRRRFISVGMILTFIGCFPMAIAGMNHNASQILIAIAFSINGLGQSTGWPGHVPILAAWFAGPNVKTILALYSCCASFGDIIGQQLEHVLDNQPYDWSYVILASSFFILGTAILVFFFEYHDPQEAGIETPLEGEIETRLLAEPIHTRSDSKSSKCRASIINIMPEGPPRTKMSEIYHHFIATWKIPNISIYVIAFSCLKACSYGILFWLANHLKNDVKIPKNIISYIQGCFSVGQLIGTMTIAPISDKFKTRGLLIPVYCFVGVGAFAIIQLLTNEDIVLYYIFLFLAGVCVGGPHNYINSAIAADLGSSDFVRGDRQAAATIAGFINGVGSIFVAITNQIIPYLGTDVFWMFTGFAALSGIITFPLAFREFLELIRRKRSDDDTGDYDLPKVNT